MVAPALPAAPWRHRAAPRWRRAAPGWWRGSCSCCSPLPHAR
ncbi:MAG: hypothetical protein AVDCRST_MAG07-422 [uncultured Frankineae bacterium]|uniref:Uncharacterized protein n=1 Tax=uncultured Frankineae bacterium TaxID=437475 RepID=A0A6J4KK33_9ACTN|nr:MAG: hypothetical protein AVDCRST_MAG07-422 [uncultured Frankineae bacterium]